MLFSDKKYLDFHTHSIRKKNVENSIEIVSLHLGKQTECELFTVGKHPWWTKNKLSSDEKRLLMRLLSSENCLAVGEIGLDKLKGEPMNVQLNIFKELLTIAVEVEKPVIIHCVRAFDNLIKVKRQYPKLQKWGVHGFSRHTELAKQLIYEGFYISLMPVKQLTQKYVDLVQWLPAENFFLETDSMPNAKIEDIYSQVAEIRNISVVKLKAQMAKNATDFFNL